MIQEEEGIRVCFSSPDARFADVIGSALGPGFHLRFDNRMDAGAEHWQQGWLDTALVDLRDAANGAAAEIMLKLVTGTKHLSPPVPIIAMVGGDDFALTRKLIENGAYDTLTSPPDIVQLRTILRRAFRFREAEKELLLWRSQEKAVGRLFELVGASEAMQAVFALAQKVAPCDVNVLITGETGTGKGLLARALHRLSQRASGPFVGFSCANMPETLVEDELFGHEKGAFTGAVATRRGRFEAAEQGTLFLDEVGDLPLGLQARLLRVLQERTFERLGSNTPRTANIRLLCATHRNLDGMVKEGKFREDLYYRLNVVRVHIPALRERRDGIPVLALHFLEHFVEQFKKPARRFSAAAMNALVEHPWPGNVRELENVVQRAVVLAEGEMIEVWDLPSSHCNGCERPLAVHSYEDEVRDFKRRLVLRTLRDCDGNKAEAARVLGVARGYLHRLINQLQILPEQAGSTADETEQDLATDRVM